MRKLKSPQASRAQGARNKFSGYHSKTFTARSRFKKGDISRQFYSQPNIKKQLPSPETYYREQFKTLRKTAQSGWIVALCPFHKEERSSLAINLEHGSYKCFSCGTKGGDILDFHKRLYNLPFKRALADLGVIQP